MAPGGEPTLGDILAVAFAAEPVLSPLEAETIAGKALATYAAGFYGVDWADAWHYITHVPNASLQALLAPEGWRKFGAAIAEANGLAAEPLPVTVH